jgi:hypothetical protein
MLIGWHASYQEYAQIDICQEIRIKEQKKIHGMQRNKRKYGHAFCLLT